MNINEKVVSKGELKIKAIKNGKVCEEYVFPNLITNYGKTHFANALAAVELYSPMSHMAIGKGAGQTAASTTLNNEVARAPLSKEQRGNQTVYFSTIPEGQGTGNVTEAGVFNSSTNGDMLCYTSFASISKTADMALLMEWTITFV